jgi:hypothetical protein
MAMQPFPFPKSSTPGARAGEGEGRLVGCFATTEGGRSYIRPIPGFATAFAITGPSAGVRGVLSVNDTQVYIVYTGSVIFVDGVTVTTLTGSIPGSDGVTIVRNNRVTAGVSTPDIVAVREDGGAYVLTSTTVSAYPDADLPTNVNSVDFLGGYFLFTVPDGRIFASELNSTAINSLSFTTAESRADGLRRIVVQGSLAYAFGGSTIEPYQNVGTTPFPLQRAATVPPIGILTTMAVGGYQDTWNGPIYFVASDKTVKALSGYDTATVSTPDVERFIVSSTASSLAVDVYTWNGRQFVVVSGSSGTWVYDTVERAWHERDSSIAAGRMPSVYHAGEWLFGNVANANLVRLSGVTATGFIESGQLKAFPSRVATRLMADFTEAAMTMYVSWSHDGGKTFSTELSRSLTDAEKYPLSVTNLGLSTHHGIIVKFRWEEAVDWSFSGATADRLDVRRP